MKHRLCVAGAASAWADAHSHHATGMQTLSKQTEETEAPQQPAARKETPAEFISSMASVLVIGLFIITFCMQAFVIPSSSMEKTLLIGDHVIVDRTRLAPESKLFRWLVPYREPHRGDIVVFLSPSTPGLYVVKRVIGQPGDHIKLIDGKVYVNGQPQNEPQVNHAYQQGELSDGGLDYLVTKNYRENFPNVAPDSELLNNDPTWMLAWANYSSSIKNGELVVPNDCYFGMGDNRDVSYDSRFWGFIPKANVVGRPIIDYWSFETPSDQISKTTLGDRIAFGFHVITHFPTKTRWSRMFHLVH